MAAAFGGLLIWPAASSLGKAELEALRLRAPSRRCRQTSRPAGLGGRRNSKLPVPRRTMGGRKAHAKRAAPVC